MSAQIPLPLGRFDRYDFALFLPGGNAEAVACLERLADGPPSNNIHLWGVSGTGKSHLLQAVCTRAAAHGRPVYVPLAQHDQMMPDVLAGLEEMDLVCLDDIDAVCGMGAWETALFNLYNRLAERGRPLVTTAQTSPKGIPLALADLKSRLAAGISYRLVPLDEDSRFLALKLRAHSRGFELPDEVVDYLSRRVARDTHTLFDWLDRLDRASLVSKKRLTIPFVRQLLNK